MKFDWNRCLIVGAQLVVLIVLAVLVCLGHNSSVTDALMAVAGSIVGIGAYQAVKGKTSTNGQ